MIRVGFHVGGTMKTALVVAVLVSWASFARADTAPCVDPRLLVLFDSSGSLGLKTTATSNYNIAVKAVLDVTASAGPHIEFGMLLFPAPPAATNCQMSSTLAVPFGKDNHAAFQAFFDGYAGPNKYSDTPMLQALKVVADAAPAATGVGLLKAPDVPKYALLLTDGSQDCCFDEYYGTGWGWDSVLDCTWGVPYSDPTYWNQPEFLQNRAELVTMVGNLVGQGIPVFVVGFGSKVDPTTLDEMAKAGGTPRAAGCGVGTAVGACYYQANNAAELASALASVTMKVGEETCNGIDDNCNGQTDEDLSRACSTKCGSGVETCAMGVWGACDAKAPVAETCNNLDDDCDGTVDGFDRQCVTACGVGVQTCTAGTWGDCSTAPQVEICNGLDDNCDGTTDEGCDCVDGTQEVCGSSIGECLQGVRHCVDGKWGTCGGGVSPAAEVCNNQDDDCDGTTDQIERKCQTACGQGVETCSGGVWAGCTAKAPAEEVCNGEDDDCNGRTDEGLERACSSKCGTGVESCIGGQWVGCTARQPTAEVCDGADNNCDGRTDEPEATTIACQTDCGAGVRTCGEGGKMGPCTAPQPGAEVCDGLDNDCNGKIDDNAPCPTGGTCTCGGCAYPPTDRDGTCLDGELVNGFCVKDQCPPGKHCVDGGCVDGTPTEPTGETASVSEGGTFDVPLAELPPDDGAGVSSGCGCRQGLGAGSGMPWDGLAGLLALVAVAWVARKVRRG